jgi:SdrD B-like domain
MKRRVLHSALITSNYFLPMKNMFLNVWFQSVTQLVTQLVFVPKRTFYTSYFTILFSVGLFLTPSVLTAQVQGKVYRDFNANGAFDSTAIFKEVGLSGVIVTAYNGAGTSIGSTATNSTGNYTIPSVSGAVRVEFSGLATGDFSGPKGASSGTSVQFVTAPITSVNYGVNYPSDYCGTTNPKLATPCYINGNPAGGGTAGTSDVFVGFPFNATANDVPTNEYAIGSQTGSTWGVAYQRSTKTLFTSAFLKRHVGLGTLGIGGIYKVDGTSVLPASVSFVDVKTIGIDVGTVSSNVTRGLPADKDSPSNDDPLVFDQIGKVGMGDMDITDDEKKLFLINLKDRKLYSIIIDSDNNSATAPTAADVQSFTIPNPNCTNGVARPFGIKIYKGKVYVGVVCTAENVGGTVSNMFAYIYALDLATGLFNATPVYSFPLNYTKLTVEAADGGGWQPWTADYTQFAFTNEGSNDRVIRPQPMLADIAFDVDGSMVVIFMDRTGHQYGFRNYSPDVADTKLYNAEIGGDILRIANVNGVFELEHNGTAGSLTGANVGNSGGPGTLSGSSYTAPSGEFYDDLTVAGTHNDITQGGAVLVSGTGQIAVCSMDPLQYTSGGIVTWSNTIGQQVNGYELYASNSNVATFGKANGLGDLEALCNPTPLEIGNRVWSDTNSNGIQDANESGISGVIVELYDGATKVGTATTNATGNYYFNNTNVNLNGATELKPNTAYKIQIAASQFNNTGVAATPLSNLTLTTANATSTGLVDVADNDATIVGSLAIISYTTGNYGENNHTLDFGFKTPCNHLVIGPNPLPSGTVGTAYSTQVTVSGGTAPYQFLWYAGNMGALPAGLSMSSTGLVSGTPTTVGSFAVKIVATDAHTCPDSLDPVAIVVLSNCTAPTITSVAAYNATCTNGVTSSDAKVAVRGIVGMTKYAYRTNTTDSLFAINATASTADSIKLTGLANPSVATTYTFRIYGIDTTCYNDTTVVLNPAVCLPCSITATFTQGACNNNGTTAISTDDYFTVTVSGVSSTNGGTSGKYEVILNGNALNIGGTAYGTPVTVGGILDFKSDGATTYSLTVRDLDIPTCVTTVFTTAASASCSTIGCKPIICLPVTVTKL